MQFVFSVIMGIYFFNLLKAQQGSKGAMDKESKKQLDKLNVLNDIRLTEPLSEKTRPVCLEQIIGQKQGIKALRAAICSPNPQHVIIYGPPGVGKTAAARVVLEEAKRRPTCPFRSGANFVELDATTLRFDERGIADPLLGSVHDPIYQGAGAYGVAGIPQPKMGAVTKAHGGILFIDEIGELHPLQINKLLKVLEDRRVFLESAYYVAEDVNVPKYIHEIFQQGLPADFRLIGATTRIPEEIPCAVRSRCVEIYFESLKFDEVMEIVDRASERACIKIAESARQLIARHAQNGRDAVNMLQIAYGISLSENRNKIESKDVEWVIQFGHYTPRIDKKIAMEKRIGCVYGLAVLNSYGGELIDIEACVSHTKYGNGTVKITGIIEQEEMGGRGHTYKRTSAARASIDNCLTVLKRFFNMDNQQYDIHINFPGGVPIDGPSAGVAITIALYSAISNTPINSEIAMTGEISITGKVKPVGGVAEKVEAAKKAGIKKVIIPSENWQNIFKQEKIHVIPVSSIREAIDAIFYTALDKSDSINSADISSNNDVLVASSAYSTSERY